MRHSSSSSSSSEATADYILAEEVREKRLLARLRSGRSALRGRAKAYAGLGIVCLFYGMALFAETLAPYDYRAQSRQQPLSPPSVIRFRDAEGRWHARPFIYARRLVDPLARRYEEQPERAYAIELFKRGYTYRLFGVWPTDRHLFGVRDNGETGAPRFNLLGTDALGRDRWSRLLIASRFSLLVGPLGTLAAAALGIIIGCIAGYARRSMDAALMRAADVMMALPVLVLILAARAAFPLELPPARAALLLILIFLAVGWAEMARVTRGLVSALRRREFVLAAESIGLSQGRILFRHILPNAAGALVVQVTLMLPAFLLAETALSFLGVGLQEPEASWGSMLATAADPALLGEHAFVLLSPAFAIFLFVLGVRLLSDGLKPKDT
ncbi:MAG TPA: ABC transporter permease [Pyrinomonadaceae bacterium]|jgi:peptide/nickel transport system permease protein|nr:ABC transporter permease [Pyrinomonadaceae bacterium]